MRHDRPTPSITLLSLLALLAGGACGSRTEASEAASLARLRAAVAVARSTALQTNDVQRRAHEIVRLKARERSYREQSSDYLSRGSGGWSIGRYSGNRQAAAAELRKAHDCARRRMELEKEMKTAVENKIRTTVGANEYETFLRLEKAAAQRRVEDSKRQKVAATKRLRGTASRPSSRPSR